MAIRLPSVRVSTFSIVARDKETKDIGIAVQSRFISVGSVVPWAIAGIGAIATQAYANTSYGPKGLELLRNGLTAEEAIKKLVSGDRGRDQRQVGIVDARGNAATFTGRKCMDWAGGITGDGYAAQGNILVGSETVDAMGKAYESTKADLPERLIAALRAGQMAGGDRRGMQSAALLIVRKRGGYGGFNDRYVDLRVDDHESPIEELDRIFRLYDMIMLSREEKGGLITIDGSVCRTLQSRLKKLNYYTGKVDGKWGRGIETSLADYISINNFENKLAPKGHIWKSVLEFMKDDRKSKK